MTEHSYISERKKLIDENLKAVRYEIAEAAIKSGRHPDEIRLMAVTKTVEAQYINHAIENGASLIGENKVQEYLGKKDELVMPHEAHLIGHLQTNKVRQIVGNVSMIQSVDSIKIATEISKQSEKIGTVTDILLEVNIGSDENKFGFSSETLEENIYEISELKGVRVQGLMTVPPFDSDLEKTRIFFSNMRQLFIDIAEKKIHNTNMGILSMGMSGDFKEAVMEGSTLVRVGSAIFGSRRYN